MKNIPSNATGVLFVVSTSHMDWHWHSTFEQYYNMGNSGDGHPPVRYILNQAFKLLQEQLQHKPIAQLNDYPPALYQYNLAEIAWLQRYFEDYPHIAPTLAGLIGFLFFLGGGMTSPDSLLSNGELFIRNYLVGRNFVKKNGMRALLTDVCWIPDDFGSDPQLPVVLKAMGMKGVSFARVPGWQQGNSVSKSGTMDGPNYQPKDNKGNILPTLSQQLANNGVTFNWAADDGSTVLAQYMLATFQNPGYGVDWQQSDGLAMEKLNDFVTINLFPQKTPSPTPTNPVVQPGSIYHAPCSGDFSLPSLLLTTGVDNYNNQYFNKNGNGVYAVMDTFEAFVDHVNEQVKKDIFNLKTLNGWDAANNGFDPSNYWTGHFANYVGLKILQQHTANNLLAAEILSTLLRSQSYVSDAILNGLDKGINVSWDNLIPSTHHDYINGTASAWIHDQEQLPLLQLAHTQAENALGYGMQLLAQSAMPTPVNTTDIPWVVFNPSGIERTNVGTVIEIPCNPKLTGVESFYTDQDKNTLLPIQRLKDGSILIWLNGMVSTGYTVVYFSSTPASPFTAVPAQRSSTDSAYYLNNGAVEICVSKGDDWALNSIVVTMEGTGWNTGFEMANGLCNQLQVYSEGSSGNPYQMGNEFDADNGFKADTSISFGVGEGAIMEAGPYRWRFSGPMNYIGASSENNSFLNMEYILNYLEPLVRCRVTGQAPVGVATSVVTTWNVAGTEENTPTMNYGTANHWNGPEFTPYWTGPTFRATHDYLTLVDPTNKTGNPLAAMYHLGMRAWAFNNNQLSGILFRNTNWNGGRGATNADTATHTQNYAFRIKQVNNAASGQPLMESLAFQQPLLAAPILPVPTLLAIMPATGCLATISSNAVSGNNAFIRMARTQSGSGENPNIETASTIPMPFGFVLRIYQPSNNSCAATLNIPFLTNSSNHYDQQTPPVATHVTALEEKITDPPAIAIIEGNIQLTLNTLTTVRIEAYRLLISGFPN